MKACKAAGYWSTNILLQFWICVWGLPCNRGFVEATRVLNLDRASNHPAALVSEPLKAIQLPSALAGIIVKPTRRMTPQSQRGISTQMPPQNGSPPNLCQRQSPSQPRESTQRFLEEGEAETWMEKFKASFRDGIWWVPDGRLIAPVACYN